MDHSLAVWSSEHDASTWPDGSDYTRDGECDDGGAGAEYSVCHPGNDCTDCGTRQMPAGSGCVNSCTWAFDGVCDDGGDGAAMAATLGEYGATTVYSTGSMDGKLIGVHGAAAMAALMDSAGAPDAVLLGQTTDGRDLAARLAVHRFVAAERRGHRHAMRTQRLTMGQPWQGCA